MPRRTPRINLTSGPTGNFFILSEAERAQIEAAYGHKLSEELWEEILHVTEEFTIYAPTVRGAASLTKTLTKLHKLANTARSLRKDIIPNHVKSENLTLQDIWYAYFRSRSEPPGDDSLFELLLEFLEIVIALSKLAEKYATNNGVGGLIKGPDDEGYYWDVWICTVTLILEEHGLPYAARKDADKRKRDAPSPFVSFICELQKYIPKQCRKFTHSHDALAQGIHRARKSIDLDRVMMRRRVDAELSRKSKE